MTNGLSAVISLVMHRLSFKSVESSRSVIFIQSRQHSKMEWKWAELGLKTNQWFKVNKFTQCACVNIWNLCIGNTRNCLIFSYLQTITEILSTNSVQIFPFSKQKPTMNAFDAIQRQFRILEIRPLQQHQHQTFALNWKNVAILFLLTLHILMVFVFLAIEASNYDEYFGSLFISLTGLTTIFFYLSFKWQANSVYKLIDDLNGFVSTRKNHSSFSRINQNWIN